MMTPLDYIISSSHSIVQLHNEDGSFTVSTSLKNESGYEDGSFTMSTSLKNEIGFEDSSFSCFNLVKK